MSTITSGVASSLTSSYGSGIDTTALVTGLVAAESQPITTLQKQKTYIADAMSQISSFASNLSALQAAAAKLSTPLGFNSMTATSSDTSVVASAIGTSSPGNYTVNVVGVAQQQRTYSDAQTSNTGALNLSGSLSIAVGSGPAVNVSVAAGDSLADLATKIGASGVGVTANVVYDGSSYRLMVRGQNSGAANAVTFGETGFSLGLASPSNTTQKAQDAVVQMDGITFSRPTNQVSGVIPGVTLAVTQPNVSTTVRVATSSNQLESRVQAFVTAYNQVVSTTHASTGYASTAASNPLLAADHSMRSALNSLQNLLASSVPGTSGPYTSLSSVGLASQPDGTLSFNASTFDTAMQSSPNAVSALFVTDAASGSQGLMQSFVNRLNTLTAPASSPVATELQAFNDRINTVDKQIATLQTRITSYQAQLQSQFIAMNTRVASYKSQLGTLTAFTNQMNAMQSSK